MWNQQVFEARDLRDEEWAFQELQGATFTQCVFRGAQMAELLTRNCKFIECDLTNVTLNGSVHEGSSFVNCRFAGANLFTALFKDCKMTGSGFEGADLRGFTITGGDWSFVNLRNHSLKGQKLTGVLLQEADLYGCDLQKADLRKADLTRAVLANAQTAGMDIRGAKVEGLDFMAFPVRGVRMDLDQAVLFAQSFGAKIG